MQRSDIMKQLKQFIANKVLDGKDIGLDETTPLLEWGVINSSEMVRLLSFIRQQFSVDVPVEKLTADHFINIATIADLVLDTVKEQCIEQSSGEALNSDC